MLTWIYHHVFRRELMRCRRVTVLANASKISLFSQLGTEHTRFHPPLETYLISSVFRTTFLDLVYSTTLRWERPESDTFLSQTLLKKKMKKKLERLIGKEASTATSPLHPTKQRWWFRESNESAHTAGISNRLFHYEALWIKAYRFFSFLIR